MRKRPPADLARSHHFLAQTGVSTGELPELFAQEVLNLTDAEQLILKDNDFGDSDQWTEAARAIDSKMLARAVVKAKRRSTPQ